MSAEVPSRPPRIAGLDVARSLALFGMFAAHVGNAGVYGPGGWRWLVATHGRASSLFAVLAGISISLMLTRFHGARFPRVAVKEVTDVAQSGSIFVTSATSAPTPLGSHDAVRHTRVRVAVRGAMLIVLGWALSTLATPVDIILDNLGVMFLLVLVAFRWRPWVLIGVGAAVLALGREVLTPLVDHLPTWLYDFPVLHELWSNHYPALIWVGYVLIGMGLGRLAPWRGRALAWLAASGLVVALLAYGAGVLTANSRGVGINWVDPTHGLADLGAHSYSPAEMLGNVGVACAVIAACCWLAGLAPRVTWPLAAAGSMTLTLYTAQVVAIAIAGAGIVFHPSNLAWVTLCAASLGFACLWRWRVGQGPLENVFTSASSAAADADAARHVGAPS